MEKKPRPDVFPADNWVKVVIGDRPYVGRALCNDRAHLVSTVDATGKSVTFSWPYICANASTVDIIPINDELSFSV